MLIKNHNEITTIHTLEKNKTKNNDNTKYCWGCGWSMQNFHDENEKWYTALEKKSHFPLKN